MAERGEIDGKLGLLTDLTDTDQVDSFIKNQLQKLSDNKYLSKKQNKTIKNLQNNQENGNSKEEKPAETRNKDGNEEENETSDEEDKSDAENADTEENNNNAENQDENNKNENGENENNEEEADSEADLSKEAAESLVYDYVKENEVVDTALLEDGTVNLHMDHETDDGNYVFQLYETVNQGNSGHTATYGWYEINLETKEIEELI